MEETNRSGSDDWYAFAFFYVEKAFSRARRPAFWEQVERNGRAEGMLRICQGLRERRIQKSHTWGLLKQMETKEVITRRMFVESTAVQYIYHDGVIEDFRIRRAQNMEGMNRGGRNQQNQE